MRATVTSKGQVTIPKALRDRLGIVEGAILDFHEESGRLVCERVEAHDPVSAAFGLFQDGRRTDDVMRALRSEGHE